MLPRIRFIILIIVNGFASQVTAVPIDPKTDTQTTVTEIAVTTQTSDATKITVGDATTTKVEISVGQHRHARQDQTDHTDQTTLATHSTTMISEAPKTTANETTSKADVKTGAMAAKTDTNADTNTSASNTVRYDRQSMNSGDQSGI